MADFTITVCHNEINLTVSFEKSLLRKFVPRKTENNRVNYVPINNNYAQSAIPNSYTDLSKVVAIFGTFLSV